MRCENCGSEDARELRVSRTYGQDAELLVIENVPVVTCSACGESYMTADTLREIENLKDRRHGLAQSRTVGVVRFDAA
jgi:YgiT-type zinc finger domain-containing protein